METTPDWLKILDPFCVRADGSRLPNVTKPESSFSPCPLDSDGTQSWENRMKVLLGPEKYAHLHWNTWACNGAIYVQVPQHKADPAAQRHTARQRPLSAPHLWVLSDIHEQSTSEKGLPYQNVIPVPSEEEAPKATILGRMISTYHLNLIRSLPGASFCGVADGRNKPLFFRFTGGAGLVMPLKQE